MEQPKPSLRVTAEQLSVLQNYWDVFFSRKGQRVLEDMRKDYCGVCFSTDAIQMAFLNGQRQVVLQIEEILKQRDMEIIVEKEEENG